MLYLRMSMQCSQCGSPAERCERCAGSVCPRRLCAELHLAACAAVSQLLIERRVAQPLAPTLPSSPPARPLPKGPRAGRERDGEAEQRAAEHLVHLIGQRRKAGRAALLKGDLETALDELWAARRLEPDLDRLGASGRQALPADWEIETDLTPLARVLSSHHHPRAAETWRRLLDDRPARSIQAEAAEWLAGEAASRGDRCAALRILHAGSLLGRTTDPGTFQSAYREAGIDPQASFALYLIATRVDARAARAIVLRDPLTDAMWSEQDPRWWSSASELAAAGQATDHQLEALHRARDLACSKRDLGWLHLAEGDHAAGALGIRTLARTLRAGVAESADEDAFVRIRLAYESAAERLPDVAWPWYRLAELLAWVGAQQAAEEHLAQAERRSLGSRESERTNRAALRALVRAGLGSGLDGIPTAARPFPARPFGRPLAWRLRLKF